jgi:hypothetical protein
MRRFTGCCPDGYGETIRSVVLFMQYIAVPYVFKQFFRDYSCAVPIGIGQDEDKFFSAIPDNKIVRSCYAMGKRLGDNFKAFVAFDMAVSIVVPLKEVNVDHQQA